MWVTVYLYVPQWSSPQLGIISGHSIFDLFDIEQVGSFLERVSNVIDVDIEELAKPLSMIEVIIELIADVTAASVMEIV